MNYISYGDPLIIGIAALAFLLLLIVVGIPIGVSIFSVGLIGQFVFFDLDRAVAQTYQAFSGRTSDIVLASVPLFLFMGQLVARSTISKDFFNTVYCWVGWFPGGLAIASLLACSGFGAVTGVSGASVATMSSVALPQMERFRYDMRLAAGSIASASAIAILIPPSLLMIIYGVTTENSIGDLFIAGIVPGIALTILFCGYVAIVAIIKPEAAPRGERFSNLQRLRSLPQSLPVIAVFLIVIGGIYGGIFTPTEAAGFGAFSILVYLLFRRQLTVALMADAARDALRLSAMVYFIIVGVQMLTTVLALSGVIQGIVEGIVSLGMSSMAVVFCLVVFYLLLGMILDGFGMVLLTLPVVYPLIMSLGLDPIWFGVVLTMLVEIGLLTPPVGINCYILQQCYPSLRLAEIFRGVVPFVLITLGLISVIIVWPDLVLWILR